jgi:hypothetical protein
MWDFFKAHQLTDWKPAAEESRQEDSIHQGFILYSPNRSITNRLITIRFWIQSSGHISLNLYDAAGRQVVIIKDGFVESGQHEAVFDASNLARGIYFYRLSSLSCAQTRSIIVL